MALVSKQQQQHQQKQQQQKQKQQELVVPMNALELRVGTE